MRFVELLYDYFLNGMARFPTGTWHCIMIHTHHENLTHPDRNANIILDNRFELKKSINVKKIKELEEREIRIPMELEIITELEQVSKIHVIYFYIEKNAMNCRSSETFKKSYT